MEGKASLHFVRRWVGIISESDATEPHAPRDYEIAARELGLDIGEDPEFPWRSKKSIALAAVKTEIRRIEKEHGRVWCWMTKSMVYGCK